MCIPCNIWDICILKKIRSSEIQDWASCILSGNLSQADPQLNPRVPSQPLGRIWKSTSPPSLCTKYANDRTWIP